MAALVTLTELKTYLGDAPASADDTLLQALLDHVQALFETETGRQVVGYIAAGSGRTEVHDGTGSRELYLDYPIVTLTSVKLGYDPASPDETLTISDKNVLVYGTGARRITRTDGGQFGRAGQPRYVQIVYDHAGDLPESAKLAIKSVASSAYRRRGSEELQSETVGNFYSRTMLEEVATADPFWQLGVAANRLVTIA